MSDPQLYRSSLYLLTTPQLFQITYVIGQCKCGKCLAVSKHNIIIRFTDEKDIRCFGHVVLWKILHVIWREKTIEKILMFLIYRNSASDNIYLIKIINRNTRKWCKIYSTSTTKHQTEWCKWHCSGVLLLTLNIFHSFFYCFRCWLWTSKF